MIIVEGPDGAGKTTLIKELVERTGLEVAPRVVSKDAEAMTDLVKWTEENVAAGFQMKIFDRHRLISEPIYGPILRSETQPGFSDPQWFYSLLHQFYDLEPIVIYCLPPFEVVWKNIENDRDNKVVARAPIMRAIWGAYYNKAMTEHVLNKSTWIYDYTDENIGEVIVDYLTQIILKRGSHV